MEFPKHAVKEAITRIVAAIAEHVAYPFQVEDLVRDLELTTRDLEALMEDVKTSIMIAKRDNGAPTKQVEVWLNKAEAIKNEADEILQNYYKRHQFIWSNYTTSRNVMKKLHEVKSLCNQRTKITVTMQRPPPPAQEIPTSSSSKSVDLELALQYIKDGVNGIIGIYGIGGVGKTHLLKQINNELCKDNTYSVVIFVTCSKECSEEKVQIQIIDKLGLTKSDSMEWKQITIYNFLKKRSFVLLLDDLQSRVDLESVGIPDPSSPTSKRKVVLTTRTTKVCGLMEVKKKIRVNVLNWDSAWNLFKEKVTGETIESNPLIGKYAVEIVKQLGGLPSALITVGRSMNGRTDPSEWKLAVERIMQAHLHNIELNKKARLYELLNQARL